METLRSLPSSLRRSAVPCRRWAAPSGTPARIGKCVIKDEKTLLLLLGKQKAQAHTIYIVNQRTFIERNNECSADEKKKNRMNVSQVLFQEEERRRGKLDQVDLLGTITSD